MCHKELIIIIDSVAMYSHVDVHGVLITVVLSTIPNSMWMVYPIATLIIVVVALVDLLPLV